MSNRIVKTIYSECSERRVQVFRREDKTYGFYEEYFSKDPYEDCWLQLSLHSESYCDTMEIVMREVHGRVEWLRTDEEPS